MKHASMRPRPALRAAARAVALLGLGLPPTAFAIDLNPGGDWQIRWDNTLRYSVGQRLRAQDLTLASPNTDDGNRGFAKGALISNRVDLLSEFDAQKDGWGLRLSAAAWVDRVYTQANDHDSPLSASRASVAYNAFTKGTRDIAGQRVEILDAFAFGRHDFGDGKVLSMRLGQHSLIWGTSLFFGMNGIAKGMAPIDVYKLSIPGTQAKETTMPVPQLSSTLQLSDDTSVEAYVQFKYKPTRLHPSGSYLSATDMLGAGAERMFIGNASANRCGAITVPISQRFNNCYLDYLGMTEGKQSHNFGFALNTRSAALDADLGFYAIQYRDTSTVIQTNTSGGSYRLIVPTEPVKAFGASIARLIGETNVGLEMSVRDGQILAVKEGVVSPADPRYVTGRTVHLNLSWTTLLPKGGFWDGASLVGEFAANHVDRIDDVRTVVGGRFPVGTEKVNRDKHETSGGLRVIFTPTWYQALPGLDLNAPVNLGWSLRGNSMVDTSFPFSGSPDRAGELVLGIGGTYLNKWNFNLSYINFLGKPERQPVLDRDYLRFSAQVAF